MLTQGPASAAELSDTTLLERLGFGIDRADRLGISSQAAVFVFVNLALVLGPHFDEVPEIFALLQGPTAKCDERARRLPEFMPPELWESASRAALPSWEDVLPSVE